MTGSYIRARDDSLYGLCSQVVGEYFRLVFAFRGEGRLRLLTGGTTMSHEIPALFHWVAGLPSSPFPHAVVDLVVYRVAVHAKYEIDLSRVVAFV